MAEKKPLAINGLSPIGRISFPKLFVPEAREAGDKPKYQVTVSFVPAELEGADKEAFEAMVEAANKCSNDMYGVNLKDPVIPEDGDPYYLRNPFRRGTENKYHKDDEIWIRFSSINKPQVIDGMKQEITEESGQAYAGMLGRASWCCKAYDYLGNRGVTFYLGNFQKTGAGVRLTGGASAEDEFGEVVAEAPAADDGTPF